ncbi:hypothetical protein THAOC_22222, partial [Thalassiosira oceanica]
CVGEVVTKFIEAALAFKAPYVDREERLHRRSEAIDGAAGSTKGAKRDDSR